MSDILNEVTGDSSDIHEFVARYFTLKKQIKDLNNDIKELKDEFKAKGVATNKVIKSFNEIIKNRKSTDKAEIDSLTELLNGFSDIEGMVLDLIS